MAMTLYEELGVPPDAPPETIHNAYRNVARLLHPDAQTNPALKESSEVQMKRINHLYEVLSHPERRAATTRIWPSLSGPPSSFRTRPLSDFQKAMAGQSCGWGQVFIIWRANSRFRWAGRLYFDGYGSRRFRGRTERHTGQKAR